MTHAPLAVGDVVRTPNALYALVLDAMRDFVVLAETGPGGIVVLTSRSSDCARVESPLDVPSESLVALYAYSEQLVRRVRVGGGR